MTAKQGIVTTSAQAVDVDRALAAPGPDAFKWDTENGLLECWHSNGEGGRLLVDLDPKMAPEQLRWHAQRIEAWSEVLGDLMQKSLSRAVYEEACRGSGAACYSDEEIGRRAELRKTPEFAMYFGTVDDFRRGIGMEFAARRFSDIQITAAVADRYQASQAARTSTNQVASPYLARPAPVYSAASREKYQRTFTELRALLPNEILQGLLDEMIESSLQFVIPILRDHFGLSPEGVNPEHDRAAVHVRADALGLLHWRWSGRLQSHSPKTPQTLMDVYQAEQGAWLTGAAIPPPEATPPTRPSESAPRPPPASVTRKAGSTPMDMGGYHPDPSEILHAKLVAKAEGLIERGRPNLAKRLLTFVARRTPKTYSNVIKAPNGNLVVKSWDKEAFFHYCLWEKQFGSAPDVYWVFNAYPKAHFLLGFIALSRERFAEAMGHLDNGERLDPENPHFNLERGTVHFQLGDLDRAYACFALVDKPGPFVTASSVAQSLRSRSLVHLQRRELAQAEATCRRALELEPGHPVALQRLASIEQVRQGGAPIEVGLHRSIGKTMTCGTCGGPVGNGSIWSEGGKVRYLCATCASPNAARA